MPPRLSTSTPTVPPPRSVAYSDSRLPFQFPFLTAEEEIPPEEPVGGRAGAQAWPPWEARPPQKPRPPPARLCAPKLLCDFSRPVLPSETQGERIPANPCPQGGPSLS